MDYSALKQIYDQIDQSESIYENPNKDFILTFLEDWQEFLHVADSAGVHDQLLAHYHSRNGESWESFYTALTDAVRVASLAEDVTLEQALLECAKIVTPQFVEENGELATWRGHLDKALGYYNNSDSRYSTESLTLNNLVTDFCSSQDAKYAEWVAKGQRAAKAVKIMSAPENPLLSPIIKAIIAAMQGLSASFGVIGKTPGEEYRESLAADEAADKQAKLEGKVNSAGEAVTEDKNKETIAVPSGSVNAGSSDPVRTVP